MKRLVLVGGTDGIGRALALEYVQRGWTLALVGRDADKLRAVAEETGGAATVVWDVAKAEEGQAAFAQAADELGGVDLALYCAGAMGEETPAEARTVLAVNLGGAVAFLDAAGRHFQEVGAGHIAAVGSVAGERGRKGAPVYCASKAGLHAYLEGLRHRLHPAGIRVSTVKPGPVRTRMLAPDGSYPGAITAQRAAELIVRGLERGRESFFVPGWWRWVGLALRLTPLFLYKRIAPP